MKSIKHYENLNNVERFELTLRALARKDNIEIQRLIKTCPNKSYTATDYDYVDRIEKSESLVYAFSLLFSDYVIMILNSMVQFYSTHIEVGQSRDEMNAIMAEKKDGLNKIEQFSNELSCYYTVFKSFCKDNDLDIDLLLDAHYAPIRKYMGFAEGVPELEEQNKKIMEIAALIYSKYWY